VLTGHLPAALKQADGRIIGFLRQMGARFTMTPTSITVKGPCRLTAGTFSLKDCPDLVPVMAILALFAQGTTRLTHIAHARAKESNRISDLRRELLKVGADIREKPGELIIVPQQRYRPHVTLDPHHDHRLAMAFAVLGLKIGVDIKTIECTRKSYPGFVKDFKAMGAVAVTS
jgi:3-phosphoshikimate 1-carboxyvinyltransferase